jgi:hypothetical protein
MFTTKTLATVVAAVATLSINAHAAEHQSNPLHPAYYAERATVAFQYLPTQAYVDAANPLHPSFAKTTVRDEWITTAAIGGKAYVDDRNPLHPAFKRF